MINPETNPAEKIIPPDQYNNKSIDPNAHLLPPANYNEAYEIIKALPDGEYFKSYIRIGIIRFVVGVIINISLMSLCIWVCGFNFWLCLLMELFLLLVCYHLYAWLFFSLIDRHKIRSNKIFDEENEERIIAIAKHQVELSNAYLKKHARKS